MEMLVLTTVCIAESLIMAGVIFTSAKKVAEVL